ncbi:hypothetical protein JHK87_039970 [Glycine soja]|nr:hypothetical protein JHK87_039970 [Glycine soja]
MWSVWSRRKELVWEGTRAEAAFFPTVGVFGFDACIRDDIGSVVRAFSDYKQCLPKVHEGEALRDAIFWLRHLDTEDVTIEMDCQSVVNNVYNGQSDFSEFGVTIKQCRDLLQSLPNFKVCFVRIQTNFLAHSIARATSSYVGPHFFSEFHSCIATNSDLAVI